VRARTLTSTTSLPSLPVASALSPAATVSRPSAPPLSTADLNSMLEVFNSPDHLSLLKQAYAVYSAKNRHQHKDGIHQTGFETLHMSMTYLDLGELRALLKAVHIVPRWIAVDHVQTLFHQFVRNLLPSSSTSPWLYS
jgi:hypothetical protein